MKRQYLKRRSRGHCVLRIISQSFLIKVGEKFLRPFLFPGREHSPESILPLNAFPHLSMQAHNMQI